MRRNVYFFLPHVYYKVKHHKIPVNKYYAIFHGMKFKGFYFFDKDERSYCNTVYIDKKELRSYLCILLIISLKINIGFGIHTCVLYNTF